MGERQAICRAILPVVDGGFVAHLLPMPPHATSVLPAPAAAVARAQVSLDSQESACSEESACSGGCETRLRASWGLWVPKGPFLTL